MISAFRFTDNIQRNISRYVQVNKYGDCYDCYSSYGNGGGVLGKEGGGLSTNRLLLERAA